MQPNTAPSKEQVTVRWPVIAFLFAYTLSIRLLPFVLSRFGLPLDMSVSIYPWNFSPLIPLCLFGGAFYSSPRTAIWLPVSMMFLGDVAILAVTGRPDLISVPVSLSVYVATAICAALGLLLKTSQSPARLVAIGAVSCVLFFLITNTVVWQAYPTYPDTPAGLLACYAAGLPFLRNTVLSTILFGAVLFSPLSVRAAVRSAPSPQPALLSE
ncbi:DUF6580 family putative transport protein [Planctomicrobium piriforme]|uniref:Uncharacterized protein n=1 Tax=Planctomicrobium piriforme TaxID=1576369 RepID=A0A1I3BZT1_9PLAN|nr:DUF6580 family putative transport protein [Planctomicrobium piriforme]SFH67825.1 hypothetical protein SAMN05421753_10221 [Planctomicrobium piriforme]